MTTLGYGIIFVGALICSWLLVFILVVAKIISGKFATAYIRYSIFGTLGVVLLVVLSRAFL